MMARATLALLLAGPALMGSLVAASHPAPAQTQKPAVLSSGIDARERPTGSRRARAVRRAVPMLPASVDDGLAYDTPRDAQGRPIAEPATKTRIGAAQTGIASWYGGSDWQGHRMSNGERYEQNRFTAAHATLPMGTKVLVTLVNSTRSVVVTVTDRPGTRTRVIDLSRAAAAALGITNKGLAQVRLVPL